MDRRLTPANGRVAATNLKGVIKAKQYTEGRHATVITPIADLLDAPDGNLDRQLLFGAHVTIFEENSGKGYAFVQSLWDGYVGYVAHEALGARGNPTHRVIALATHVYPEPSIKTRPLCTLSLGSDVTTSKITGDLTEIATGGFIPSCHLRPIGNTGLDWVSVAEQFLGVPYLWGGNSAFGIDCAGLVQIALRQVGICVPADSDLQEKSPTLISFSSGSLPKRGELVFWAGHVGIFQSERQIIHANGHHMSVSSEDFSKVCTRISKNGGGHPTAFGSFSIC